MQTCLPTPFTWKNVFIKRLQACDVKLCGNLKHLKKQSEPKSLLPRLLATNRNISELPAL